jgi:hypothetical protein
MACWWVLVHCDPVLYGFIKSIGTGFSSNFELFEDDTTNHAQRFFKKNSIRSFGFGYISSIGTGSVPILNYLKTTPPVMLSGSLIFFQ